MSADNHEEANLVNLPTELFLYICSYLDFPSQTRLKKAHSRFDSILTSDELHWRHKFSLEYPATTMIFPETVSEVDNDVKPWSRLCYEVEKNQKFLNEVNSNRLQRVEFPKIHKDIVPVLKLVVDGRLCISGSYDKTIAVWNVTNTEDNLVEHINPAHGSSVSCIETCNGETFCSGSSDKTVKLWSMEKFSNISTHRCNHLVLSISCKDSLVAAGLWNSNVEMFDTRVHSADSTMILHDVRGMVFVGVILEDQRVYAVDRLGTVRCFDIRAKSIVKASEQFLQKTSLARYSYRNGTFIICGNEIDHENAQDVRYETKLAILNSDLEKLAHKTFPRSPTVFRCIIQNDYDFFVGNSFGINSYLKSNSIARLASVHSVQSRWRHLDDNDIFTMQYDPGNVMLLARKRYSMIMFKREENAYLV